MIAKHAKRGVAAGLLALALFTTFARPASAHGGPLAYTGDSGPYRVEVYRIVRDVGEQYGVRYLLHLRNRVTGERISDATVVVSLMRESEVIGPFPAAWSDPDYELQLLMDGDGWTVDVRIESTLGSAALTHPLPLPPTWPGLVAIYGGSLLFIGVVWKAQQRIRARGKGSSATSANTGTA